MEDKISTSWEAFTQTGNIEAYLLYKQASDFVGKEDKDSTCQVSEQEALS